MTKLNIERNSCTISIREQSVRIDFLDGSLVYYNLKDRTWSESRLTKLAPYENITNEAEDTFRFLTFDGDIFYLPKNSLSLFLILLERGGEEKTIEIGGDGTIKQTSLQTCDNNFSSSPSFKKIDKIEEFLFLSNYAEVSENSWVATKKTELESSFDMRFFRIRRAYCGGAIFDEAFVDEKGNLILATNSVKVVDFFNEE